jgi:hypothetical protein
MLNIDAFRSQLNSTGWAVQNCYDITIPTQALAQRSTAIYNAQSAILQFSDDAVDWMADYFSGDTSTMAIELQAYCQQSELPSYQFQMETNRSYGPSYKIPHRPEYQDTTMTFMCGNQMNERWFFEAWMYMVMDFNTNNFNYISEYCTDIAIVQYPDFANSGSGSVGGAQVSPNYYTILIDAYPIAIAQQPLAYANNNTFQTIQVTFTYKYASAWTYINGGSNNGGQTTAIRSATGTNVPFTQTVNGPGSNNGPGTSGGLT